MNASDLQQLLERVSRGDIAPDHAAADITAAMARAPFEDLGFARLDTHRSWRQGFPEVILGLGKTPAQIAGIAERIVAAHGGKIEVRSTAAEGTTFSVALPASPPQPIQSPAVDPNPASTRFAVG